MRSSNCESAMQRTAHPDEVMVRHMHMYMQWAPVDYAGIIIGIIIGIIWGLKIWRIIWHPFGGRSITT